MVYTFDHDLEFLGELDDDHLAVLVEILTKDTKGKSRTTEELTTKREYRAHYPHHSKYWKKIAEEIQLFGGNTFVNFFRGSGVQYKEILCDVCSKMKVNYNKSASTQQIEKYLLDKILKESLEAMTEEERKEFVKSLDLKTTGFTSQAIMIALQAGVKLGGFLSYQIAVIVANIVAKALVGHGLSFAANATLTRTIGFLAGPVGWIATGLWTAWDISGPAYRVTIPICIEIACLRQIHAYEKNK